MRSQGIRELFGGKGNWIDMGTTQIVKQNKIYKFGYNGLPPEYKKL